jgi:parvulin-like peptidyl-prolyl isomerase
MLRIFVVLLFASCSGSPGGPSQMNSTMNGGPEPVPQSSGVVSADILSREPLANAAQVKHILIGWNDGGEQKDPRAQKRTKKEAEDQIRSLMTQIKAGADFDALMKQWSEDPGSASSARSYAVAPDAQLVIEFKQLGLRLKVGEVGVVQSDYGFHIMKRVE